MMKTSIHDSKLYKLVVSDKNIFLAINSMQSYIFEKYLLSDKDLKLYHSLIDIYNHKEIKKI